MIDVAWKLCSNACINRPCSLSTVGNRDYVLLASLNLIIFYWKKMQLKIKNWRYQVAWLRHCDVILWCDAMMMQSIQQYRVIAFSTEVTENTACVAQSPMEFVDVNEYICYISVHSSIPLISIIFVSPCRMYWMLTYDIIIQALIRMAGIWWESEIYEYPPRFSLMAFRTQQAKMMHNTYNKNNHLIIDMIVSLYREITGIW